MTRLLLLLLLSCAPPTDAPAPVLDRDGDTILDVHEDHGDADADGLENADDLDADGDGYDDALEAGDADPATLPADHDADGTPDFLDADADNDGLLDVDDDHPPEDADRDRVADPFDLDDDADGLSDVVEGHGDADGDGAPDGRDPDSDDDGLPDTVEACDGALVDSDGDGRVDARDTDSDDDGVRDAATGDLDGDGRDDYRDLDDDGDGLPDTAERLTSPRSFDSDSDGASDGAEAVGGSDPLNPTDTVTVVRVPWRTSLTATVSLTAPIRRPDVALLVDTSCSMTGSLVAVKTLLGGLVDAVSALDDGAVGVALVDDYTFDDPAYSKPFTLRQPETTDLAVARSAVDTLSIGSGTEHPAAFEAFTQAATGAGYDTDCDGAYDTQSDVPPWSAAPDDLFGGAAFAWEVPTEGAGGGMGFRGDGSVPVVILVTDDAPRHPDAELSYRETPGGCPADATLDDTAAALAALGAVPVVAQISTTGYPPNTDYAALVDAVLPAPGVPLLVSVDGARLDDAAAALTAIMASVASPQRFTTMSLDLLDDPRAFVVGIGAPVDVGALRRGPFSFTLDFLGTVAPTADAQAFPVTVALRGDGTTTMRTQTLVVEVPGRPAGCAP